MSSEGKTYIDRKIQDSDGKVHNEEISLEAICQRLEPPSHTGFVLLGARRLWRSGWRAAIEGPGSHRLSMPGGLLRPVRCHNGSSRKCRTCALSTVILLHRMPLFRPIFIWSLLLWYLYRIIVCGCRLLGRVFTLLVCLRHWFSSIFPLVRGGHRQDARGVFLNWRVQDIRGLVCGGFTREI